MNSRSNGQNPPSPPDKYKFIIVGNCCSVDEDPRSAEDKPIGDHVTVHCNVSVNGLSEESSKWQDRMDLVGSG